MAKEEITPSEWQIMEVLWACGEPLTSSEVYKRMQGNVDMSMRMVRVLMNRLNQKDILGYTVDEHDSRVYHYYVQKSREECVKEKSRKFVDSYFSGNGTNAMAALLQSFALMDEQIKELEEILEKAGSGGQNPRIKRSDDHARLETISQPHKFLHGLLHYPACAVYGIFLRADRACDAAPEDAFSGTDFFKGNAVGIVPGHPVSWKTEDVL